MTKAEHYKVNLRLALPVMIGQLGHIMVSVADSIMVGQLGTIELAAVALGNSIFGIFMVFGIGMSFGITPLTAEADGMKRTHLQGVLLRQAFYINLLTGLLILGVILAISPIMDHLDQDPGVVVLSRPYLIIIASSMVPMMGFMTFKQFAEGLSDTKMAMAVSVGCNLVNVGLNYLLIYGKWGLPELGLNGAGWATLIARILMVAAMGYYVIRSQKFASYKLSLFPFRFRNKVVRRLLQIGIPSGLQYVFEVSAFALAAVFAGMINATALAAHQIAINIASVSYMAATGLGAAATVRVGNQKGLRNPANLRLASSTIFNLSIIWMAFTGIIIFFFRDTFAQFYSDDPAVLALAGQMLLVVVVFQLSDGVQVVGLGALRGFTDVRIPTLITFGAYWLFTLPLAFYLSQYTSLGAMGIWYSLAAGLTISAGMLVFRYRSLLTRFTSQFDM